jgi:antagonist of KipI
MMGIKIIKAGLQTTVQDHGRTGYRKDGIIVSGAMDTLALQIGNLLLGNEPGTAGLECTLLGPKISFETAQLVALTGGDLSPLVDGVAVKMWRPLYIEKGAVLSFGAAVQGCRTYLTVFGGFKLQAVLGSYSTYLKAGFGGYNGRALKSEDTLSFNKVYKGTKKIFNWSLDLKLYPEPGEALIRVLKGPEYDLFTGESLAQMLEKEYLITNEADRMGYRLQGSPIQITEAKEMLSSAVCFGTVQVSTSGAAIILMADHQTTGGYPRVLQVITADLTRLAQMKSGQKVWFKMVTLAEARAALLLREKQVKQLEQTITFKYI